ncbi:MAG: hypothetical protein AAB553_04855 [Patescibacteria group bacterium]
MTNLEDNPVYGSTKGRAKETCRFGNALSPRENRLVDGVVADGLNDGFSGYIYAARTAVLEKNMDAAVVSQLDPRHARISLFALKVVDDMDRHFDSHRKQYALPLSQGREPLLSALDSVTTSKYGAEATIGGMFQILLSLVDDKDLYDDKARERILGDYQQLRTDTTDALVLYEAAPLTLSVEDVTDLKRRTDETYAHLIFDLECAALIDKLGYDEARRMYGKAMFAAQYTDDILDFKKDTRKGVANLLRAYASVNGELPTLLNRAMGLFSAKAVGVPTYFSQVAFLAPLSYEKMRQAQEGVSAEAGISNVTNLMAIPSVQSSL